jgi:hypothetical protein
VGSDAGAGRAAVETEAREILTKLGATPLLAQLDSLTTSERVRTRASMEIVMSVESPGAPVA